MEFGIASFLKGFAFGLENVRQILQLSFFNQQIY